ncbi:thiazole synthase [Alteromonas lipotrueiana]|uniref:thiazole synthase n=1 Tax=Alteromonas lipotrueiana TaxID=2803815 RepID=UPI001C43E6E6
MLNIAETQFSSRLFTGTGKFANTHIMQQAIGASRSQMVTLAMKRVEHHDELKKIKDNTVEALRALDVQLLPNTSGAKTAEEAVYAAHLSQELLGTPWVKLEIHPDTRYLLPDPIETLKAATQLVAEGFVVLPYCHADPVLCKRLEEAGCAAVMPLAAPIGSNRGLLTREFLQIIIEQAHIPVVVDAGIGKPSEATAIMEMGADAVLINSAIASASNPCAMAGAFAQAVETGRIAYESGLGRIHFNALPTSPADTFLEQL